MITVNRVLLVFVPTINPTAVCHSQFALHLLKCSPFISHSQLQSVYFLHLLLPTVNFSSSAPCFHHITFTFFFCFPLCLAGRIASIYLPHPACIVPLFSTTASSCSLCLLLHNYGHSMEIPNVSVAVTSLLPFHSPFILQLVRSFFLPLCPLRHGLPLSFLHLIPVPG